MSKLISGKEALIALANGEEVQYKFPDGIWMDFTTNLNLRGSRLKVVDFLNDYAEFRLKPRTINLNGIEVPAPFEPKFGEKYWIIETSDKNSYSYISSFENDEQDESLTKLGAWRTEDEIKQVVAALRSIFKPQ